jgi:micrococcal nuclease
VDVISAVETEKCSRSAPKLAAIACGVALAFNISAQDRPPIHGIVTAVLEGDTLRVQLITGPTVVRLANIDAPEPKQPGGAEARKALHDHVLGEEVALSVVSRDESGWLVAVVHLGDENVNGWMVKQGHAWAYRPQVRDADYCVWEDAARSLKRGLWAREEWLAPWEWRQGGDGKAIRYTNYRQATAATCMAELSRT